MMASYTQATSPRPVRQPPSVFIAGRMTAAQLLLRWLSRQIHSRATTSVGAIHLPCAAQVLIPKFSWVPVTARKWRYSQHRMAQILYLIHWLFPTRNLVRSDWELASAREIRSGVNHSR